MEIQQVNPVMPRLYNSPDGRLWLSSCLLPMGRFQDGGKPHTALADWVFGTSYPTLISLAQGISGSPKRSKSCHCPKLYNAVQRGQGYLLESPDVSVGRQNSLFIQFIVYSILYVLINSYLAGSMLRCTEVPGEECHDMHLGSPFPTPGKVDEQIPYSIHTLSEGLHSTYQTYVHGFPPKHRSMTSSQIM